MVRIIGYAIIAVDDIGSFIVTDDFILVGFLTNVVLNASKVIDLCTLVRLID